MVKLLYAGFDTLDIAFKGALPETILKELDAARERAEEQQEAVLVHIGPDQVAAHIESFGKRGGYRYLLDTGPLGAKWMLKRNTDLNQWNLFASPRATALLAYGFQEVFNRLLHEIAGMGGQVTGHAINRADYAMDFETNGFELYPEQVVSHSHSKVSPFWGKREADENQPGIVMRGRRVESVTIGKQPGRQIIIYDKRREAIERKKFHWFEAWDKDRKDTNVEVWRVEVRAGKKELKDKYQITTIDDFEAGIGDVIVNALDNVRYLADRQGDSNVSRQALSPLWQAAEEVSAGNLSEFRSGLTPGQVKELERSAAQETYVALCLGNAIGLCVARGLSDDETKERLPEILQAELVRRIEDMGEDFRTKLGRTRERLVFLD